ncbi:MAG: hypothetical protein WED04_00360 [Promethearchaeati archaeon SRVP18_Atabeyarchaeia-1]
MNNKETESTQGKKVIVSLDEKERITVDRENNPKEISINGVLSINNTSDSYRIYNTYLPVSNHGITDVSEGRYPVGEIGPKKAWKKDYVATTETPTLSLEELIDTNYGEEASQPHRAFYVDKENPTIIKISLRNNFDRDVSAITLKKTLPADLSDVESTAGSGEVEVDEGNKTVKWTLESMQPNEEAMLTLKGILRPSSSEPIKCGGMEVAYKVDGGARSNLELGLESLTKSLSSVNISETASAGKWLFEISFDNNTDLVTVLNEFAINGGGETIAKFTPNEEIPAGESWKQTIEFDSREVPELEKSIKFTVAHEVHKSIDGLIIREDDVIPVGQISCAKQFDPPEIPAYETYELKALLTAENAGSVEFDSLKFVDMLPKDFKPPKAEDVKANLGGGNVDCEVEIEPQDEDHGKEHTLTITVPDILDKKGGLPPGDKLIVEYPITAVGARPPSETKYPAPLHVTAFCRPPGLGTDSTTPPNTPEIVVKYVKRVLTGGTGFESVEAGVYEITIQVNNKGEAALENVAVEHWIPPDFEFVEYSPKRIVMEEEEAADGRKVKFIIPRMNKGAGETITYRVKGRQDAHYSQTEAKFRVLGPHKKE